MKGCNGTCETVGCIHGCVSRVTSRFTSCQPFHKGLVQNARHSGNSSGPLGPRRGGVGSCGGVCQPRSGRSRSGRWVLKARADMNGSRCRVDSLARFRGQLYELSAGGDKRCLSVRHAPSRGFGSIYQLAQGQSRISHRGRLFLLANSGCPQRKPLRDMLLEWHFWTNLNQPAYRGNS